MKKLMAMIGAVAMSFGLFAATTQSFSISFEEAESEKGVDTSTMLFTPPVNAGEWAWTGEALPLTAYGEEPTFAYGTGAFARRSDKFAGEDSNDNYLPLETGTDELVRSMNGNIYLDQLVKFTGFEDSQTNLVEGTKIAIWMSEFENEDESTTTNLYVTVGKVDVDDNAEQIALKIDGNYSLNTWYRLSIKSLGNIFTSEDADPRAGFLVYVNGQQVASSDDDAKTLIANEDQMDGIAKGYMAKGQLFTAIDNADATFATVGYQGIGAVDDIIIDAEGPKFCQTVDVTIPTVEGAEVDYVDVNGTHMQPPISVPDGTTITVYFKATEGMKLTGDTSVTQTITSDDYTIEVDTIVAEEVVATLTVEGEDPEELAESELADALAALEEGDKIETVLACGIYGEEEAVIYSFTPNTTITGTADGLSIYIGAYDEEGETVPGSLEVNDEVGAGETLAVSFDTDYEGNLTFGGTVAGALEVANGTMILATDITLAAGASIKAVTFDFDTNFATITLNEAGAQVKAYDDNTLIESEYIVAGGDLEAKVSDEADGEGYFTYTAQEVGLIDLEITAPENTTVTEVTGETVVPTEDGWKAEEGDALTITLTADDGFYFDEDGKTTKEVEATAAAQIDLGTVPAPFEAAVSVAATIGTKYYASADAALAAVAVYTKANPADTVTATFIKAAAKENEYAFAAGVTVKIYTDYNVETPAAPIHTFWEIKGGDVTFLTGLENNKRVSFNLDGEKGVELTFAGKLKPGAILTADGLETDSIELSLANDTEEASKVNTTTALAEEDFVNVPAGYMVKTTSADLFEDGTVWFTYELAQCVATVASGSDTFSFLTSAEALEKVQELEADSANFPIVATALVADLAVVGPNGVTIVLAKDETITITANSWVFSGGATISDGPIALAASATFKVYGKLDKSFFSAPTGYEVTETDAGDGWWIYSAAQSAKPGFKIIISGIDAADVTEDATTITIATEAQPLVYIGGVAATVGGEAGAWTVTKPAITADTAVSILKGANIPTTGHPWYENPTLMGTATTAAISADGNSSWNSSADLAGDYLAISFGQSAKSGALTTLTDLTNADGADVPLLLDISAAGNGGNARGAAVCAKLGVMILGNYTSGMVAYSLDGKYTNKLSVAEGFYPDAMAFSADGKYLYVNRYEGVAPSTSADRENIYKYEIKGNLLTDGTLELAATYPVGNRVRCMKQTDGGKLLYAKTDAMGWYCMDTTAAEPVFTQVDASINYRADIEVVGEHVYILNYSTHVLNVYNRSGNWYTGEPIATLKTTDLESAGSADAAQNFFVTANEETMAYICVNGSGANWVSAYQWTKAPGFMIRIAGIDAADVEENDDSITIKTEAQPLVYIGGVAATVGGEAGAWTVTKPAITADTAISIVEATTIPTTGHAWYENPTLMGKVTVAYGKDGCGGWNGAKDLAGDYIAAAFGYSGLSAVVTKISDLVAGNGGEVDPVAVFPASEIGGSLRGAGISTALGVTIFGSAGTHEITVISLDGLTTNKVTTSNGVIPDSFWFSDDGQFLYANGYEEVSGDSTAETAIRQNVYKYAIVDNLIGDGEKLVVAETYTVGKRVRGMTKFGDVILARTDDGYYAIDLSAQTPAFERVGDGNKCDDVVIAGDHFYHVDKGTGILSIYNLNAAGTWYEGDAIMTINVKNVLGCRVSDTGNNFFVTPDEETLVFCETVAQTPQVVKAFQWTLPTYDITFAAVENGTLETSVTNDIAAGTMVTVTATPVTGYECTEITTNGAAITGTSFDMPAEDVEIGATFALQTFTVTFKDGDNDYAVSNNVPYGTAFDDVKPENPTKAHFTFQGWTPAGVAVTADATYTAQWLEDAKYTVTFSTNTVEMADAKLENVYTGTALTAEMIPAVEGGEWDVDPVGAVITCNTNFNYTVKAGPDWPSDWPKDVPDAMKEAFQTWATTYGVTSFEGVENAFLMNDDPKAGTATALEITSIEVADGVATIKVAAGDKNLETGINGVLFVSATDDLAGEWKTIVVEEPDSFENEGKTAVFEVEGAQFMKAKVDFKVEEVEKQ